MTRFIPPFLRRRIWRRLLLAAVAIVALGAGLLACVAKPDPVWSDDARASAAALNLSVRAVDAELDGDGALQLLGAAELVSSKREFGGFSGLKLSADGTRMLAISDAGAWFAARLIRGAGPLQGIEALGWGPLRDPAGAIDPRPEYRDSEGLAALPGGGWIISFEGVDRLTRFAAPGAPEQTLRMFGETADFGRNSGLEALARRPDGTLLGVRENGASDDPVQHALIMSPGGATLNQITLPKAPGLRIVGADIDESGRLWTVQRGFTLIGGFFFALEVADPAGVGYGPPRRLGMVRGEGADNAEGIALWRDPEGRLRVSVITDDNFFPLQRTLFYDFVVARPDDLSARAR